MPQEKLCKALAPNLDTIIHAANNGRLCLMECQRVSDKKLVAVLCAVNYDNGDEYSFVPLAEMCDGNPYQQYQPPAPEGGFHPVDEPEPDNGHQLN